MYQLPEKTELEQFLTDLNVSDLSAFDTLWNSISDGQIQGFSFEKQIQLDRFVVDFYCERLQLVIEIDTITYPFPGAKLTDEQRQEKLETLGMSLLNFNESMVNRNMFAVLGTIDGFISEWERTSSPIY